MQKFHLRKTQLTTITYHLLAFIVIIAVLFLCIKIATIQSDCVNNKASYKIGDVVKAKVYQNPVVITKVKFCTEKQVTYTIKTQWGFEYDLKQEAITEKIGEQ